MNDNNPITTAAELSELMQAHPDLGYEGWRTSHMSADRFLQARDKLQGALKELDLCRRAYRDQKFCKAYSGRQTTYRIKHRVEAWDFSSTDGHPTSRHNGYVCQGIAAAAALLEGFNAVPRSVNAQIGIITIPSRRP